MKAAYLPQIDLVKGVAIVFVVLIHFFTDINSLPPEFVRAVLCTAVPIFVLVMAFNATRSFVTRPRSLKQYFKARARRLLPAFFLTFVVSLLLGIAFNLSLRFGEQQLVGYFIVPGPGNYFIPLVFQFVILFPLLYWIYRRSPKLAFLTFIALNAGFEALNILDFAAVQVVYHYCIARFLAIVWLGFFLASRLGGQNIKTGLRAAAKLPLNFLGLFGRASYHIFLVQPLLFGEIGASFGITGLHKLLLSFAIGILFYYLDCLARTWVRTK